MEKHLRHVIFNFHGIGKPGRDLEPGEAPYWIKEDRFAEILDIVEQHRQTVRIDFTLDDGNLSDFEIAAPGFERYGHKASIFILADRIGRAGSLGEAEIRALADAGHVIGTHGAAHVDWKTLDPSGLNHELGGETRQRIEAACGRPVTAAAIPFGRYNATVLRALARQGYSHAYSSDGGPWRDGDWPIPRTSIRTDMSPEDIESTLLGQESRIRRIRRGLSRAIKKRV